MTLNLVPLIINHPIPCLKLASVSLNVMLTRKLVFNQIVTEYLIKNNFDRYRNKSHTTIHTILLTVGVFTWINSSFAVAHGTLIAFGLLVKILHTSYKRFTIKTHSPIIPDEQVLCNAIINIIASYSSILDIIGIKRSGYPIDSKYIKESIAQSNEEDMQELAKHLKLTHLDDKKLFNQQVCIFFSCASKKDQERFYKHFDFLDTPDIPTDAELGANLLKALPDDITEFLIFPHAKKEDLSSALRRCKKLRESQIHCVLGRD